jgi:hypothetical protein
VSRVVTTSSLARRITGSEPPAGEEHKNLHPIHSLSLGGGRRALVLHSRSASARGGDPAHSHTHRVSRLTIRLPYPPPRLARRAPIGEDSIVSTEPDGKPKRELKVPQLRRKCRKRQAAPEQREANRIDDARARAIEQASDDRATDPGH